MKRYRCAVLSVVKHSYIARAVAAHPRFELVVVGDEAESPDWTHVRNQQFAEEFQIPYVRDVPHAVRDFESDIAVVSCEAERHCRLSIQAADAGLHVIQDKPLSTSISECDRLIDTLHRNKVKFQLWNRNFFPSLRQTRRLIESGELGRLLVIHMDFYFSKDAGPALKSSGTSHTGERLNWLDHQIAAHVDGSDGGVGNEPMGELEVEGIYPLAYLHLLSQVKVERVFARTSSHFHQLHADNNVDDLASVTLELENGMLGSLCIGRIGAASHPDLGEIKLHLIGTNGAAVISEPRPEVGVYYRGQPAKEFRNRRIANENDFLLMQEFLEAIENDTETTIDALTGRAICATTKAAIESGKSGQVVDVAHRTESVQ